MGEKCFCESNEIIIFFRAGGFNLGQIANEAAIKLAETQCGKCGSGLDRIRLAWHATL
jgi:uncharacterized metal-binding protein